MATSSRESPISNCLNIRTSVQSLNIVALGGPAYIGCPQGSNGSSTIHISPANGTAIINVTGVVFSHTSFFNENCTVNVRDSIFNKSKLLIKSRIPATLDIFNSKWIGGAFCVPGSSCNPIGELLVMGFFRVITLDDVQLLSTRTEFTIHANTTLLMNNSKVSSLPNFVPVLGRIRVALFGLYNSNITIKNSIFSDLYHWNPIDSVMNIFEASLLVRSMMTTAKGHAFDTRQENGIAVTIDNVIFTNSERGLTLQGAMDNVYILNSEFSSNIAMHAGAGMLVLTDRHALVKNCTFQNNAAGNFRVTETRNPWDRFEVIGDEVQIYSKCCKGSISLIGKGGAVRVQKGKVTLEKCTLKNNTARLLGGTVFVDRAGQLQIVASEFSNIPGFQHSAQGDFVYSNGKVNIVEAALQVKQADNHISAFQHSGDHWSVAVHKISIFCPMGHRLRVMNTSAYAVTPNIGLKRSYMLDQLSYFCESCPRNKYSIEKGSLLYKLDDGIVEYYTLMINGKSPNSEFQGNYSYKDIYCKECPYGGLCDFNIRALPNFWGYRYDGGIKFQVCPRGYCCAKQKCESYDTCAANRCGTLCSSCIPGYSEALFSSMCIPDEECGVIWIWPFFLSLGLLYALFLLFQKDVRDFIFSQLPWQNNNCLPWTRKRPDTICYSDKKIPMLNGKSKDESIDIEEAETTNETLGGMENDFDRLQTTANGNHDVEESKTPPPPQQDIGAVLLIILLYYFQDSMLFNVKTVGGPMESKTWVQIKALLLGFFKFRLEVAQFVDNVCMIPGLTPSNKMLIKTLLVPYVIIIFATLFVLYHCYTCSHRWSPRHSWSPSLPAAEKDNDNFTIRLSTGFMLAMLFTYQRLATTAFTLLNCVDIGNHTVLFVDGRVVCYQLWQYGVLAYAVICIVPFFMVLIMGPGMLRDNLTTLPTFFTACIFPLPFFIIWFISRLRRRKMKKTENNHVMSPQCEAVYKVLQGPFKDKDSSWMGLQCWAGVLIARRLVLVLIFTFVNNTLVRILIMLVASFFMMLHHVHGQPYKDFRLNIAGSISVSAMMLVGGINLVRAGFEAAEYIPQGPNSSLIKVLQEVEDCLMLWFPLAIFCIVVLALILKISALVWISCSSSRTAVRGI